MGGSALVETSALHRSCYISLSLSKRAQASVFTVHPRKHLKIVVKSKQPALKWGGIGLATRAWGVSRADESALFGRLGKQNPNKPWFSPVACRRRRRRPSSNLFVVAPLVALVRRRHRQKPVRSLHPNAPPSLAMKSFAILSVLATIVAVNAAVSIFSQRFFLSP